MRVDYIARKVTLDESFRQLTEKKLAKITKYFNDILDMRVEVCPGASPLRRWISSSRAKTSTSRPTPRTRNSTAALQEGVDKLEIQARRAKARLKDHKPRGGEAKKVQDWEVEVLESDS